MRSVHQPQGHRFPLNGLHAVNTSPAGPVEQSAIEADVSWWGSPNEALATGPICDSTRPRRPRRRVGFGNGLVGSTQWPSKLLSGLSPTLWVALTVIYLWQGIWDGGSFTSDLEHPATVPFR
jgi:hypothetical protein